MLEEAWKDRAIWSFGARRRALCDFRFDAVIELRVRHEPRAWHLTGKGINLRAKAIAIPHGVAMSPMEWQRRSPLPILFCSPNSAGNAGDRLTAPMPGLVKAVRVAAGDMVKKGQILLVLEAMKMEHSIIRRMTARLPRSCPKVRKSRKIPPWCGLRKHLPIQPRIEAEMLDNGVLELGAALRLIECQVEAFPYVKEIDPWLKKPCRPSNVRHRYTQRSGW